MGSPRKGDSYKIIKTFEEKLKTLDKVEFEYLFLKELNLGYCHGCCICMAKGEDFCPAKDITLEIRRAMLASDGVIFASPVYAHQVTALMKNFIDHFSYVFHRPCFFDKSALIISTTGGSGLKEVLDYLGLAARGWGFNVVGKLGVIAPAFQHTPAYRTKVIKEITALSQKLFNAIKTGVRPSPTLYDLIFFRAMKCKAMKIREHLPYDYEYWKEKGWLDKDYYLDVRINPFKNLLAKFIEGRIKKEMSKFFK